MQEDERLTQLKTESDAQIADIQNQYQGMINETNTQYQNLISQSNNLADEQARIQQEQGDLALQDIQDQQARTERDYNREQRGAYDDYRAQTHNAGVQLRAMGLQNTGYTETTVQGLYNTYQNRVATARQSYQDAVVEYGKQMASARLANSSALAEIAQNAFKEQMTLTLQGMQYKNELIGQLMSQTRQAQNDYWDRYKTIQSQINTEKSMAEEIRQYNENLKLQQQKLAEDQRQFNVTQEYNNKRLAEEKRQFNALHSSSGGTAIGGSGNGSSGSSGNNNGNSTATMNRSDYYFSNGYQPQYINNVKLKQATIDGAGLKVSDLGLDDGYINQIRYNDKGTQKQIESFKNQKVWVGVDEKGNQAYYIWIGNDNKGGEWIPVTNEVNTTTKKAYRDTNSATPKATTNDIAKQTLEQNQMGSSTNSLLTSFLNGGKTPAQQQAEIQKATAVSNLTATNDGAYGYTTKGNTSAYRQVAEWAYNSKVKSQSTQSNGDIIYTLENGTKCKAHYDNNLKRVLVSKVK